MSLLVRAFPEPLKAVAFGSIGATYSAVGTPLSYPCRILTLSNGTNAPLIVSLDGTNDHFYLPAGTNTIYNLTTNSTMTAEGFQISSNTQFYVKYVTAAASGSLYIGSLYGRK